MPTSEGMQRRSIGKVSRAAPRPAKAKAKAKAGQDVFGWSTLPVGTEQTRASLQRRLAFYSFMVFVLSGAFFPAMIVMEALGQRALTEWTASAIDPFHLAGVSLALVTWLWLRTGERSLGILRATDAGLAVGVCTCWTGMGFGAGDYVHVEFFILVATSLTLTFRCATVPSSGQRTLIISSVAMSVVVAGSFLFHLRPDDPHPLGDRISYTAMTAGWSALTLIVASVCSHVIFGLRRRASEAFQLGQYQLVRKIGAGGMGVVYEAKHALLRRPTVIKLLAHDRGDEAHLSRFEREVQMTSMLTHPNTIAIYDYGRTPEGVFYYAMEYLDGPNLQELVDEFGPLPARRVIHLLWQLCGALAEAHDAGMIHRDIKPANIILTNQPGAHDLPKLLDFGLVKDVSEDHARSLTQGNMIIGTPRYLSPEMIRGDDVDARSDLYSLGVVAYYLLTGVPVFEGKTAIVVCSEHLTTAPAPPSERVTGVPKDLEQTILQCLEKDPANRPADALTIRRNLEVCEDAGSWAAEDAQSWWDEHGSGVTRRRMERAEKLSNDGNTLAVDLDARGPTLVDHDRSP